MKGLKLSKRALHMAYRDINQQYKQIRRIESKLGIPHKARWRQLSQMTPRYRRFAYVMFGVRYIDEDKLKWENI